jgi:SPOR domain
MLMRLPSVEVLPRKYSQERAGSAWAHVAWLSLMRFSLRENLEPISLRRKPMRNPLRRASAVTVTSLLMVIGAYAVHHATAARVEAVAAAGPSLAPVPMLSASDEPAGTPPRPLAVALASPPPVPSPAPRRERAVAPGTFAIHVASVSGAAHAAGTASEWRRLTNIHPSLAGLQPLPPRTVEVPGKGSFYRVLGGPFRTRSEALAACSRLRAEGGAYCKPLPL